MDPANQITIEPTLVAEAVSAPADSTIKTILLHVQNDRSLEARLQVALSLARVTGAHLSCLHVTPIEAYVTPDRLGGVFVMERLMEQIDEQEENLRSDLEERLRAEDLTWDYQQLTGNTVGELVRYAALSDIVITGRRAHVTAAPAFEIGVIGDVLMAVRTPLFVPGDGGAAFDPFGPAIIAWNGSYEAANAVRSALGLLKLSKTVRVVRVTEGKDEQFPPTGLLEYLSRHGIHADLDTLAREQASIAEVLAEYAKPRRVSYMVMGGYGHNRAGEFLFGGVTRSLLKACPVALVLAH